MYGRKPLDSWQGEQMRRKIRLLPHFDFQIPLKSPHPKITGTVPTHSGLQRAAAALEKGSGSGGDLQVRCRYGPSPAAQWTARARHWRRADSAPRRPPAPAGLGERRGATYLACKPENRQRRSSSFAAMALRARVRGLYRARLSRSAGLFPSRSGA